MAYSELMKEFAERRVVDFEDESCWQGPDVAYRLREEYDDEVSVVDRLSTLLDHPDSDRLQALIIGAWSNVCEGDASGQVVAELVNAAPRLPNLRALFFGEMTYEECEIS